MSDEKPYGPIDPNSQHQMWSRWIFGIHADAIAAGAAAASFGKRPSVREVVDNARSYFAKLFHSTVGRVRCDEERGYYVLTLEIEGVPAHDLDLRVHVERDFCRRFMTPGFGPTATLSRYVVGVLAGDCQDGKPPIQLLVMPWLDASAKLHVM